MAQLFPRRANTVVRAVLIVGGVFLAVAPIALLAWARSPAATGEHARIDQPMAFSHAVHVNGMRIDCRYCHAGAERSAAAGLPPTQACVGCHTDQWLSSAPFAPVRRSIATSTPIQWQRVTSVPDFVYFSHVAHTRKGVGCETCHGRVDLMMPVHQMTPLTMGWCLQCHVAPEKHIRPREDVTTMGWKAAGDAVAESRALVERYHVRSLTTCTACHR